MRIYIEKYVDMYDMNILLPAGADTQEHNSISIRGPPPPRPILPILLLILSVVSPPPCRAEEDEWRQSSSVHRERGSNLGAVH